MVIFPSNLLFGAWGGLSGGLLLFVVVVGGFFP